MFVTPSKPLTNKELRALLNEFDDDLPVYIDCWPAVAVTRERINAGGLVCGPKDARTVEPALFFSFLDGSK